MSEIKLKMRLVASTAGLRARTGKAGQATVEADQRLVESGRNVYQGQRGMAVSVSGGG